MPTLSAAAWDRYLDRALAGCLPHIPERQAVIRCLLEHYLGCSPVQRLLNTPLQATPATVAQLHQAIQRLDRQEPIQYILGYTFFLGARYKVTPDVLIPRPETEALTQHIIQARQGTRPSIIDLCTGSRCMAISLARAFPGAAVYGLDISHRALAVAQHNARQLGVQVHWLRQDLLTQPLPARRWTLMVSNPPYVPRAARTHMQARVLDYEPHQALFVPDEAPLLFYERLATLAATHLASPGWLYVETHEALAQQVAQRFRTAGLQQVTVHHDLQGKERWVAAHQGAHASKEHP